LIVELNALHQKSGFWSDEKIFQSIEMAVNSNTRTFVNIGISQHGRL
jgi:hypothetical protein